MASSARYAAIYSSFAILILFMIWLYVGWLVLLVGAAISFYLQHPESLYAAPGEPRLSNRMGERLALSVMHLIGSHFVRGQPPWTLPGLTQRLSVPMHVVGVALGALVEGGLLRQTGESPPAYLPARDLAEIPVAEVLSTIRAAGEDRFLSPGSLALPEPVEALVARIDAAVATAAANMSIRALIDQVHEHVATVHGGTAVDGSR